MTILLLAGAGAVLLLLPDALIRESFVLVDPDRTTRPINPVWVRAAGGSILLCALGLLGVARVSPRLSSRVTTAIGNAWSGVGAMRRLVGRAPAGVTRPIAAGLLGVTAVGAAIRIALALQTPISGDEAINYVQFASRSLLDIVSDYRIPNNHVLHTLLASLSFRALGESTFAFRLPALAAGILCIPAVFALARRMFDVETALLAAGITAVIQPMVEYSTVARGYSLLTLWSLLTFIAAVRIAGGGQRGAWLAFIVASALGIFTVTVGVYSTLICAAWLVIVTPAARRKEMVVRLIFAGLGIVLLSAVLYTPVLVRSGLSLLHNVNTRPLPLEVLFSRWADTIRALVSWCVAPSGAVMGPVLALGLLAGLLMPRAPRGQVVRLLLAVPLGLAPLIVQRIVPVERTLVFLVPVLVLCVAAGWRALMSVWLARRGTTGQTRWVVVTVAAVLLWGGWLAGTAHRRADPLMLEVAAVTRTLAKNLGRDDVLVSHHFSGLAYPGRYYLMLDGSSPRLFHSFLPGRDRNQLDPYRRMYVFTRDCTDGLAALGFSSEVLQAEFDAPSLVYRSAVLCVILVTRKADRPLRPSPYPHDPWGFAGLW